MIKSEKNVQRNSMVKSDKLLKYNFITGSGSFLKAKNIIKILRQNGFQAYIAGGAVRDMLADEIPVDFDLVTNADIHVMEKLFYPDKVKIAGKAFPVCIVDGIEVAPCRNTVNSCSENDTVPVICRTADQNFSGIIHKTGKAGCTVHAHDSFIIEDLGRRDFTINSVAFDPFSEVIIDPFSGAEDLKKKVIRFTGNPRNRIAEDPLRMIRACRFAAKIKGTIAPDSFNAIKQCGKLIISQTAFERIRIEILKAMSYCKPSIFFYALHETGLLNMIFHSLDRCFDLDGGPHHGETVFEHCMLVGDALLPGKPLLRLAGYLHDVGKYDSATIKNGSLTFPGHEQKRDLVVSELKQLKFSTKEIDYIDSVISVHMFPLSEYTSPKAVRKLLVSLNRRNVPYSDFLRMRIADRKGNRAKQPYSFQEIRGRLEKFKNEIHKREKFAFGINDLKIKGTDIMNLLDIPQGPAVGAVLEKVFEQVLDNPNMNDPEKLKKFILSFKGI